MIHASDGRLEELIKLKDYLCSDILPLLEPRDDIPSKSNLVRTLFLRIVWWLESVCKLNDMRDIQALASAARGLLELAVDITLLCVDAPNQAEARITAWEDSAKLKHALNRQNQKWYQGTPCFDNSPYEDFIKRRDSIENARLRFWPVHRDKENEKIRPPIKGRHPRRWTGRSLEADAKKANNHSSKLDDLLHTYRCIFTPMCWYVHGSSALGFRGQGRESLSELQSSIYALVFSLGIYSTRLVLAHENLSSLTLRRYLIGKICIGTTQKNRRKSME